MSFGQGTSTSGEDMSAFYETLGPEWTGVETVCRFSNFKGHSSTL